MTLPSIQTSTDPAALAADPTLVIDLSAVDALTDEALVALLGIAQARFAVIRAQDPRRLSLAYSDAKLAVDALSADQRRRRTDALVTMTRVSSRAARAAREVPAPRPAESGRELVKVRQARTGDLFLGAAAPADIDEEW